MRKGTKGFLAGVLVGAVTGILIFVTNVQGVENLIQRFCDGAFCGGLLCLCLGGLQFARNKGSFDIMGYGLAAAFRLHVPGANWKEPRDKDFVAYRDRKAASRKSCKPMILAGLVYLAVSFVLLAAYYLA